MTDRIPSKLDQARDALRRQEDTVIRAIIASEVSNRDPRSIMLGPSDIEGRVDIYFNKVELLHDLIVRLSYGNGIYLRVVETAIDGNGVGFACVRYTQFTNVPALRVYRTYHDKSRLDTEKLLGFGAEVMQKAMQAVLLGAKGGEYIYINSESNSIAAKKSVGVGGILDAAGIPHYGQQDYHDCSSYEMFFLQDLGAEEAATQPEAKPGVYIEEDAASPLDTWVADRVTIKAGGGYLPLDNTPAAEAAAIVANHWHEKRKAKLESITQK